MNARQRISTAVAVLALSPLAAIAGGGDEASGQWLDSLQGARTVQEVRAEVRNLPSYGQQHPVEVQQPASSTLTRAEVQAELAKHGVDIVGA
jgi:hypothetical protein